MICTSLERFWPGSVSTSATTGFTELLTVTNTSTTTGFTELLTVTNTSATTGFTELLTVTNTSATTGFTELLTVTNINSLVVTSSSGNYVCSVNRAKKLLFYN